MGGILAEVGGGAKMYRRKRPGFPAILIEQFDWGVGRLM
jgi:hypothetical protein